MLKKPTYLLWLHALFVNTSRFLCSTKLKQSDVAPKNRNKGFRSRLRHRKYNIKFEA